MPKHYWFMPFADASSSARELSKALKWRRIRREGSNFQGNRETTVINWGCGSVSDEVSKCNIINDPRLVRAAANKLSFFKNVSKAARVPPFTTELSEVQKWLEEGSLVVGRTDLNGRSGTDIVFIDDIAQLVQCPLFTKYIKKAEEYRVHFAFKEVIDVQRKVARKHDDSGAVIEASSLDFRVRNHRNGFVFSRNNLHTPDDVLHQAELAYKATGLDFGAVDVIWNNHLKQAFILEINTAPGLEGTTLENYVKAFQKLG